MSRRTSSWIPNHPTYPAQSLDGSNNNWNQTPTPEDEQPSSEPRLPKYIHAVKDARNYRAKGRTLCVFLDGTGDKFDNDNSNIVNMFGCLKKDDPSQILYYQSGIGTYGEGGLRNGIGASMDMAVGSGLGTHILDAYRFLMDVYHEGDKICLFGFSRGAYTARCLAGMLHKVGLLPAHNEAQVQFAYQFYKDDTQHGWQMSNGYKKTFCMDVDVHFIGLYDCVASVGMVPRKLPLSGTPSNKIRHFRHAMALDEHRAKFKVLPWSSHAKKDTKPKSKKEKKQDHPNEKIDTSLPRRIAHRHHHLTDYEKEARMAADGRETDVKEVWFVGAHADVGGGAVFNEFRHKLSRIPLRWMLRQAFECDTEILFSTTALAAIGLDVDTLYPTYHGPSKPTTVPSPSLIDQYQAAQLGPLHKRAAALQPASRTNDAQPTTNGGRDPHPPHPAPTAPPAPASMPAHGTDSTTSLILTTAPHAPTPEQAEDHFDSLAPVNDQLALAKFWWILELWPVKVRLLRQNQGQLREGEEGWVKKIRPNLGRYRAVRGQEPRLHWTVGRRGRENGYEAQGRLDEGAGWVDVA